MGSRRHHFSVLDVVFTYFCYMIILLVGYVNDFLRPETSREKHRPGYVSLYASFDSFYARHVYRRVRINWFIPVSSVPAAYITLMERKTPDNGRTIVPTGKWRRCINLGSYNYLGFAENHGACAEAAIQTCRESGIGVTATRLEAGTLKLHKELDNLTAQFVGTEDSITFGMGFATNSLNIPCIIEKGCLILSDEKNHASIILGLRLSGATVRLFKHNNMRNLEKRLREGIVNGQPRTHIPWRKVFIFVEGVYSMEGSIVSLPQIISLKKKYGAYIYLDEAHSIGALGRSGHGVTDYFGVDPREIDILMGTFTKSFGSCGGYIAGSRLLIEHIRRSSHAHFYGTGMSPPVVQQIITSMSIIMGRDGTADGITRLGQLNTNAKYFRQRLEELGFRVYGNRDSPVVPVAVSMPTQVSYVLSELCRRGVATAGAIYPAAPLLKGRVRFCLSSSHTKEMLDKAIETLDDIGNDVWIKG